MDRQWREGPREPRRPRELSVHQRLLAAARELFAAKGYERVSTASIARQAGTSESQLIKHFGSKEGLLEAVFDEGWHALDHSVRQALVGLASPLERFLALSGAFISALGRDRQLRNLLLLEGRRIRKHGRQVVLSTGFRRFVGQVDEVLREMEAAGQLRPDVHREAVRSALMGAVEGLLRDQLMAESTGYPATYGKKQLLAAFTVMVGSFLEPSAARVLARDEGADQATRG